MIELKLPRWDAPDEEMTRYFHALLNVFVEAQEKIMEPFFTTKEVGAGVGLGLSISYGIIQQHKGTITFSSDTGGTEFIIKLPKNLQSNRQDLNKGESDSIG